MGTLRGSFWTVLLGALVAGGSAGAADVPANRTTQAALTLGAEPVPGQWEVTGDRDWHRVRLERGEAYALYLAETGDARLFGLALLDAAGKPLAGGAGDAGHDAGLEVIAPRTGTYHLQAALLALQPGGSDGSYEVAIGEDCAASVRTRCRLRLGTPQERTLLFSRDVDWLQLTLDPGRTYGIEGAGLNGRLDGLEIALLDRKGRLLTTGTAAEGQAQRITGFTPSSGGPYFVRVRNTAPKGRGAYRILATGPG